MKKNRHAAIILALALSLSAACQAAMPCLILNPVRELNSGDYLFLAAAIDESGCAGNYTIKWYSSIDGLLGESLSIKINNLSAGNHIIELEVQDSCRRTCKDEESLTINPASLEASISSPSPKETYWPDELIYFDSTVSGGMKPYTYRWNLDRDYASDQVSFTKALPSGRHLLLLEVRDQSGSLTTDEVSFDVIDASLVPIIMIDSPNQNQTIKEGQGYIDFSASVEGGKKPYSYRWLALGRILSEKEEFRLNDFRGYINQSYVPIVLEVTDSEGRFATSSVYIRTAPLCDNDGICLGKENHFNCPSDCSSGSPDGLCDKVTDNRCDPDCSIEDDIDCICDRDSVCDLGREDAVLCPLECVQGSYDQVCDPESDGVCDPDCGGNRDPDCSSSAVVSYLLIIILVASMVLLYAFIKRRAGR